MNIIYKKIKKYFPSILNLGVLFVSLESLRRYIKYSSVTNENSESKLLGRIIADYHVIEKGLTMPVPRLGFGKERILLLIINCIKFIDRYGTSNKQICVAIGVILEYKKFHELKKFILDNEILTKINELSLKSKIQKKTEQLKFSKHDYYKNINSKFDQFSKSRKSIRNYSNQAIPSELINKAIDLAKFAPSSCNRQTIRAHVYECRNRIRQILNIQGGNRGFGHLADKLIILTSDLAYWHGVSEIHGPYVDGGIFAMNLMYTLHFYGVASCPLNCNLSPKKEKKLRKICNIPDSEVFIVMLSLGMVSEQFEVPASIRYSFENIISVHKEY
ncbi:MAG: nitroreductase family protein [Flavobacteriaceae bacterium]|nr:nitroreductase family protein [Flavobacteriaceae bacterium]